MATSYRADIRHAQYYLSVLQTAQDNYLESGDYTLQGLNQFDKDWGQIQRGQAWASKN